MHGICKPLFSAVLHRRMNKKSGSGVLAADILSRIFVNTADRFIVIFGGYFVSLEIRKMRMS